MRFVVEIEQVITVPMVVEANSEREARALATQLLQRSPAGGPESVGDPIAQLPRIRSARKLGE
ncbi:MULTISPECIES: hypothetical protein [unclassified Microbulbifer]|uniref:hypothetical protein n=1 Tax=unclassified Microbulbifer TaxID=2619833 RepID=UPI0027E59C0F|nr:MULTISPECIES: hypothetical protein [unclassified Microbulbifer]